MKNRKVLAASLASLTALILSTQSVWAAEPQVEFTDGGLTVQIVQDIGDATLPPETWEQDGGTYLLQSYTAEPVQPDIPDPITKIIENLESEDESLLAQTVTQGGVIYTLTDVAFAESEGEPRSVYLTSTKTSTDGTAPETALVEYTDEETGETIKAELPLTDVQQNPSTWQPDQISSRYYDYDAEKFQLGAVLIPKNEAAPNWEGYEDAILTYLGEMPWRCRITGSAWVGAPYELDGVLVRDAVYTCDRLVSGGYTATYADEVALPSLPVYIATVTYTADVPEPTQQTITAVYMLQAPEKQPLLLFVKVLIFGAVLIILGVLIAAILFLLKKKRKEKEEEIQRIEAKR